MNKKIKTILAAGLLTLGMAAQACNTDAWDVATNVTSSGPADQGGIARYSGVCAMDGTSGTVVNNGATANSQNSGPATEDKMIARFYFHATGTGSDTIFTAYSEDAATTAVFTVDYDGSAITVTPLGTGAGLAATVNNVALSKWHSIEVEWNDNGALNVWVDSDATNDNADATTTTSTSSTIIEAVKMGGSGQFTSLLFDSYESRRNTPIGRLLVSDANGDGTVNVIDASAIVGEALGSFINSQPNSMPDCTQDGQVNVIDASCAVFVALSN